MTTHPQQPKENTGDSKWALFCVGILVLWILPEILDIVRDGVIVTRLSPALPGGIPLEALEPWNISLYRTAMVLKYLALVVIMCAIVMAVRPMIRGEVFRLANARWLEAAAWAVGVWFISRYFIEGLGNNYAASTLGIDSWWESTSGTPLSDLAPAFLLLVVFVLISTIIRRGVVLRGEVDGLV